MAGRADCRPARNNRKCEEGSGKQGRSETEGDFAGGAGKQGQATAVRLPGAGEQSDGDGEKAFGQPDAQPGERRNLASGQPGGGEGGRAEKDRVPSRRRR